MRTFTIYALVTLALVVLLGLALAAGFRAESEKHGLTEGTSQALLIARTAIEPRLDGAPLDRGLSGPEHVALSALASRAVADGQVLRIRVRDLDGKVVFSDDGSGLNDEVEDEVLEAARGAVVSHLTRVNSDANDEGVPGEEAVEVYLPLQAGDPARSVGVLEIYLPYAPIAQEVQTGTRQLYLLLAVGLVLLYLALFLVSLSVTRGLRRQVRANKYLAEHDPLTDLPNRAVFQSRLREILDEAQIDAAPTVVANIDLDRFKVVNDTLGHPYGDEVLVQLADRLATHMGSDDTVARLGGDEFGVILRRSPDPEAALWLVKEIIEREVRVRGFPTVSLNCSVGYVLTHEDGEGPEILTQRAEVAMYVAKAQNIGVFRYDPRQDHHDASHLSLITEVRRAIDADELVMHYQPQVQLSDEQPRSVEALVRWQHPSLGLLMPDRFIPLVEQTDLIHDFTDWVLVRALSDVAALGSLAEQMSISVNISARNLARHDFPDRVARMIAASTVAPDRLILEITETALLTHPERARQVLQAITAQGIRVSLDDFGVGQTSLSYVAALPIAELKIDRSFVTDMPDNPVHAAIVRSIVDLARGLNIRVVAEGVETPAAESALHDIGCELAQGYLFSRPLTLAALHDWLTDSLSGEHVKRT